MRIDELPRSDRIEDRRAMRMRRGGIGIGTLIILGLIGWALGIDPRLLIGGAEILSRWRPIATAFLFRHSTPGRGGRALRSDEGVCVRGARQCGGAVDGAVRAGQFPLRASEPRYVFGGDLVGVRVCPIRHGSVLLPARPQGLSGHLVLRGYAAAVRGVRHRARPVSSRRPTSSRTRSAITCRTCSASCRACSRCSRAWTGQTPTVCR